jgi:DNA processing protein
VTALDEDAIARLRLIRTPSIGPVTFFQLVRRFGNARAALEAVPDLARRGGGRPPALATRAAIEREAAAVAPAGARYLFADPPL